MTQPTKSLRFRSGDVVFRRGDPGDSAYLVESGAIDISIERGGEIMRLARRKPGEIFGEMAIVDKQPRTATATAAADSVLRLIPASALCRTEDRPPDELWSVIDAILQRYRETLSRVERDRRQVELAEGQLIDAASSLAETLEASDKFSLDFAQISRFSREIEEISLQSTILSVNASVEAARSGKLGAGFAIVATEMRALAERTKKNAKEIDGATARLSATFAQVAQGMRAIEAKLANSRDNAQRCRDAT